MIDVLVNLDGDTPVLIQGATGRMGLSHMALMRAYGTNIVAGTSARPQSDLPVPIFGNCRDAVQATAATVSIAMVGPADVLAAATEAIDAGVKAIVTIAEGMPVHDALRLKRLAGERGVSWLGASTPGLARPRVAKVGFLPDIALNPGRFAVLSKSGTLSYEVGYRLVRAGLGQSIWIGVGGDAVKGVRFADLVEPLCRHDETDAIILIGEVGGTEEEEFAEVLAAAGRRAKPVFAVMAGREAKEGVSMGHAGAIVHGSSGTLASKMSQLREAGAEVFESIGGLLEGCVGFAEARRRGTGAAASRGAASSGAR